MYNLIRFLQKHHFILLFVLLEVIAISLLSRSHTYHSATISHNTNKVAARLYEINASVTEYFSLRQANKLLRQQNAELQKRLAWHETHQTAPDSLLRDTVFDFLPARAISFTSHLRNNYIIINKGRRDGVQKDMGLVAPEGVVGIIIGVSDRYATAMSLLHKYATLSIRFKNNDQVANLHWKGGDYRFGEVVDIPTHVELQQGDTILSSGHSLVFPEGLMIGTVDDFVPSERGSLNTARIKYAVDFNSLRNVYVVKNYDRKELDLLIKSRPNE